MLKFGMFYLDKEKDIVVSIYKKEEEMSYVISVKNHTKNNLINNLARIANKQTTLKNGEVVIEGDIPCFIKGDGKRVYILRLNGTKLANIYPDGQIEVNSLIPAIAKTLMSQTKDYKYTFRETLVKSYVPQKVKLHTDLHTHGNANLNADILIALAIKHQIAYPLYYIKKLQLTLSASQSEQLQRQREAVISQLDLGHLKGKYRERKIDDCTFINFADLIFNNKENANENIQKIRNSLSLLKDSQAVFTNLEKLYLYRYVFTKGILAKEKIEWNDMDGIEDEDIRSYLYRAMEDLKNEDYCTFTLYEDTLLWIGREYQKRHIYYVEISDTTLVKKDESNARMLAQIHHALPLVKKETGVDLRFLAAIRRIPLTLVKDNIPSNDYLTQAMQALKVVCSDPYVVGSDFVGEEINDIAELREVIQEIVTTIAINDPNWVIRVHAGENDSLKSNMAKAIELIEDALMEGQQFPLMRIGHGLYSASLSSKKGKELLDKIKEHKIVLEFQLSSNVRLNNIIDLKKHPLKTYLQHDISCVMGTDGYGLYGTDSIDEQIALSNFIKITDEEFLKMKATENEIISRKQAYFHKKWQSFSKIDVYHEYKNELNQIHSKTNEVKFAINKQPTYPIFKLHIEDLPWDKYPIIIAGGSFSGKTSSNIVSEEDKKLIDTLLLELDPNKIFFVVGHKVSGQEKYLIEKNHAFDIYSIIPSLMTKKQIRRLQKATLNGFRISTESSEMGIYKSFNYEIFERRNSVLIAFSGNSAISNLVQEARNGKGKSWIFIYPKSVMLRDKAISLDGYVTMDASVFEVVDKIKEVENHIGEQW